jgi:hypothetical protein
LTAQGKEDRVANQRQQFEVAAFTASPLVVSSAQKSEFPAFAVAKEPLKKPGVLFA